MSIRSVSTLLFRIETVSDHSKSFRSPSTTTFAFGSSARIDATKSWTICACWCRCTSELRVGGWKWPSSGWSPPFELKWFAITNRWWPLNRNSPASGFRLVLNAVLFGSMRPGLAESSGPFGPFTTVVAVVEPPPGRSTNDTPRSVRKRKTWRMFPPGSPPSWSFTGLM